MQEREKSPFSELHHVTIAVNDIERAVKFYESIGIGPFKSFFTLREFVKLNVPDESAFFKSKVRQAKIGAVSLQLVEPPVEGKTIYREFLDQMGEGVQHLGFLVDDIDKAETELKGLGLRVTESARRADGSGFTYFDTEAIGGVTLEIRQNPSNPSDEQK